jgi:hypothetical protein
VAVLPFEYSGCVGKRMKASKASKKSRQRRADAESKYETNPVGSAEANWQGAGRQSAGRDRIGESRLLHVRLGNTACGGCSVTLR